MSRTKVQRYSSVWDALADTPEEAANLRVRSELMHKIASLIQENGWTRATVAERCVIGESLVDDLLRGRISHFPLDALVNIAAGLGQRIRVELEDTMQGVPPSGNESHLAQRRGKLGKT